MKQWFDIGQKVEFRSDIASDWTPAEYLAFDSNDDELPHRVLPEGEDYGTWVKDVNIRYRVTKPKYGDKVRVQFEGVIKIEGPVSSWVETDSVSAKGAWVDNDQIQVLEQALPPIPDKTVVTDSHGCEFILTKDGDDRVWVRIGADSNSNSSRVYKIGGTHYFDSIPGLALQKLARQNSDS